MTKSNIIWGLIFGFLSSVTYFHFVSNDSVYQSEKLFKYVGFVDYSEDVISHEQLMKLIEENYQRIPKCNYALQLSKLLKLQQILDCRYCLLYLVRSLWMLKNLFGFICLMVRSGCCKEMLLIIKVP